MKNKIIALCSIIFAVFLYQSSDARTISGRDGVKADIPDYPERIACFYVPAYDKILMMSDASRIGLVSTSATPWACKFYPLLRNIPNQAFNIVPDVERLLKLKIDLVIYPKGHIKINNVVEAGVPAICPFNDNYIPSTLDEYIDDFQKQMMFFSDVLGPESKLRAEKYCKYLEKITEKIRAMTSKIPESGKPKIYYGKTTDLFSTQGKNTIMRWFTELAGGIYLPKSMPQYFATVTREQVIAWNPDIILLGMFGFSDEIGDIPGIKSMRAYKSGCAYRVPAGVFYWDMTSCETALLPLFLGKKFHPDLFRDWDIVREMKNFYSEIYKIFISDKDAERILDGLPPL
jgi:iron complex transport system substrate-binding protein